MTNHNIMTSLDNSDKASSSNRNNAPYHQHQPRKSGTSRKKYSNKLLDQDDIHIGIIGSGLAGLSAALSILRAFRQKVFQNIDKNATQKLKKIKITIYERDASPTDRKEGYGMTITYNPDGPLAKLDLLEEVAKRDCPSRCHYLFDSEGFVRGYFGNEFYDVGDSRDNTADTTNTTNQAREINRGAGQRGNIRIPRSELRNILFKALKTEAEEISSKYADSQYNDASVHIDGSSICSIQWNRRLVSYFDRPMESKMNSIFCKDHVASMKTQQSQDDNQGQQELQQVVERPVLLNFDDGSTDRVDLLVGADGVNSVVARQYLSTNFPSYCSTKQMLSGIMQKSTGHKFLTVDTTNSSNSSSTSHCLSTITKSDAESSNKASQATVTTENLSCPQYLGIFLILGITDSFHPHLDERGFYTLDGEKRLFVMPFEGSKLDDARHATGVSNLLYSISNNTSIGKINTNKSDGVIPKRRKTMWQLSFPVRDYEDSVRLKNLSPEDLQKEVLRRCGHWHEPFPQMVHETPLNTIWGTGLLDRDPQIFIQHRQSIEIHGRLPSHVVIIGDAAHSMSPFKGQGANQALADGPLLASWLLKSKLDSAVRGFMTEMARRSGVKVRASRESAAMLHSEKCWDWMAQSGYTAFHGVNDENVPLLLSTLKERGVSASLGMGLDGAIRKIICELGIASDASSSTSPNKRISLQEMKVLQSNALEYASTGNTFELRLISRMSNVVIPTATDSTQRTCLHLAAANGHADTCRWLLSEVNANCQSLDNKNKTAFDLAMEQQHDNVASVLKSWMAYNFETSKNETSKSARLNGGIDAYQMVEKHFRGIRTMKQLCAMLKNNRNSQNSDPSSDSKIQHVIGCPIDDEDHERDQRAIQLLAEQHGAVLLRNFVSREADQLALAALALRPLNFNYSEFSGFFDINMKRLVGPGNGNPLDRKAWKMIVNCMEKMKSLVTISADSSAFVQTNFGPQSAAYDLPSKSPSPESKSSNASSSNSYENLSKKRKVDSFPLSKLRYLNLGEWNYNWGDREYEKVSNAMPLPQSIISLAQHATSLAACRMNSNIFFSPVPFDMAICNLYHLHRPSDRLGGHKDNVESNLSLPLVTVSLGAPGIFLLGGESREDKPTAILLRAGDCMVLSSKSRGYFHGVPTILEPSSLEDSDFGGAQNESHRPIFPELNYDCDRGIDSDYAEEFGIDATATEDELTFVKAFLCTVRMNLSIRQV